MEDAEHARSVLERRTRDLIDHAAAAVCGDFD